MKTLKQNAMPQYKILQQRDVRDIPYLSSAQYQEELDAHWKEQQRMVYKYAGKKELYIGHFFQNTGRYKKITDELQNLMQYLSVKEGINFVLFANGKYGFVGYYGVMENGFWIE